jgi:hypothetical protein
LERDRIADQREIDFEMRQALAEQREHLADARDASQDRRQAQESERQRQADASATERDRIADERDRAADERDRVADERDRVADQREIDAEVGEPPVSRSLVTSMSTGATLAATHAAMRQHVTTLALTVERIEEEVATTFDLLAHRRSGGREQLHDHAAVARHRAASAHANALRFRGR